MAWRHFVCKVSDKEALVVINDEFKKKLPVPELPLLSWFGVYCKLPPGNNAFCDEDETSALDQLEDQLLSLADEFGHGWAVYVFRIATYGIREYYVYHGTGAEMGQVYSSIKKMVPDYRIEFETTKDPAWEQYKKYV